MKRYAVEESHEYYKQAYELLSNKSVRSQEEDQLLIGLLIKWAIIFYYRGDFKGLTELLLSHEKMAESHDDKQKSGMFYAWLGFALSFRMRLSKSYQYFKKAIKIGEEEDDQHVIGYASAWLTWTCLYLGDLDDALNYGEKAKEISMLIEEDQYLHFKSLSGLAFAYFCGGEKKKCYETGKIILEYSRKHSNNRGMVIGYCVIGFSYILNGDYSSAIEYAKKAAHTAADPFYSQLANDLLLWAYFYEGKFEEAVPVINEMIAFGRRYGCEIFEPYNAYLGVIQIVNGDLNLGYKRLEEAHRFCLENGAKWYSAMMDNSIGMVFLNIVESSEPNDFAAMARDIGFPIKDIPTAAKKAESHLIKSIEVSEEIGAKFTLAEAYLLLGLLHKAEKGTGEARKNISKAIHIFEQIDAEGYLKQAKEALVSMG